MHTHQMSRRITTVITLAASGAIVFGALTTTAGSASTASRAAGSRAGSAASSMKGLKGTFTVAVMAPYTGGDASEGSMVSAGGQMAEKIINSTGGIGGKKLALEF